MKVYALVKTALLALCCAFIHLWLFFNFIALIVVYEINNNFYRRENSRGRLNISILLDLYIAVCRIDPDSGNRIYSTVLGLIIILFNKSMANIELILWTLCITHLVVWQNLAWLVFFSSSKHAVVEKRGLWRFCRNAVDKRTQTHEKSRSKCHFQELWINVLSQSSILNHFFLNIGFNLFLMDYFRTT